MRPGIEYKRSAEIQAVKGRPPVPNFLEPVDYVAWIDRQYAFGKPKGSAQSYSRLWPEATDSGGGMAVPSRDVRAMLLALSAGPEWQPAKHPLVEEYLDSVSHMLEVFRAEVERAPGYRFAPHPDKEDPRNPMLVLLPKIDASRHAIPCLLALAWRKGADRQAQLLDAWRLGLRHAGHLQDSKQLILGRIGMAIRLTVYESMRAAASTDELDSQGFQKTRQLLTEVDPGPLDDDASRPIIRLTLVQKFIAPPGSSIRATQPPPHLRRAQYSSTAQFR